MEKQASGKISKKKKMLRAKRANILRAESKVNSKPRGLETGTDITLLIENLKLTPTERARKAQIVLDSILSLQSEANVFRSKQNGV